MTDELLLSIAFPGDTYIKSNIDFGGYTAGATNF